MIEKELEIINKYLYEDETYIDIGYDDFEMFKSAIECLIFYFKKQEKVIDEFKRNYISKDKIIELLDRFDLEEGLQNYYDDLSGSEAVIKILKILLKGI